MGYDERSGSLDVSHVHPEITGTVGQMLGARASLALDERALEALASILCEETEAERVHLTLLQNETPYMVVQVGPNERCDLNAAALFDQVSKSGEPVIIETDNHLHKGILLFPVPEVTSIASFPIFDRRNALAAVLTVFSSSPSWNELGTEQKARAEQLQFITERLIEARLNADRLSDYLEIATDWVWEQDKDLRFTYSSMVSPVHYETPSAGSTGLTRWDSLTGKVTDPDLLDAHLQSLKDRRPFRDFRYSVQTDSDIVTLSIHGWPIYAPDGRFLGYRGIGRDVTEEEKAKKQVAYLANHDALTGLLNRAAFMSRLEQVYSDWMEHGDQSALMLLDLDNFKTLNDTHGHAFGDAVLMEVAARLRSVLSSEAIIARLGGDEFAILDPALIRRLAITECAETIVSAINTPANLGGKQIRIGCSVGIALLPQHGADGDQLLGNADLALYAAKNAGRNRARFFEHPMRYKLEEDERKRRAMRYALPGQQIAVAFRSVRALHDDAVVGAEAILVWTPPNKTPIQMRCLAAPLAQADEALEIGTYFLRAAAAHVAGWNRELGMDAMLKVTLNSAQSEDPNLLQTITEISAATGLEFGNLQLNLSAESVRRHSGELKANLASLTARGVRIGMIEYGSHLVSPFKLQPLGISRVDLDLEGLHRFVPSAQIWQTAKALTHFAVDMGLKVCTSGYDRHADHDQLRECGGHTYISRPLHHALGVDEFSRRLQLVNGMDTASI